MDLLNLKKTFAKYVFLNVAGMIGLSCYILADTLFIARGLGAQALAALNLALPAYSLMCAVGLMIGTGGATRYSISTGKHTFTAAVYMTVVASAIFLLAGLFFTPQIASLLGANEQVHALTVDYLRMILCFAPAFLFNNVLLAFVRNDGNPRLSMLGMLFGSLSNIVLDILFIFPFGWGMAGAALATGIGAVVSLAILSQHFISKKNTFTLHIAPPRIKRTADIVALGSSAFVIEIASAVVLLVFNMLILRISGNIGIAAYGIVANLSLVIISIFSGIAQGIQPIISYCCGREKTREIRQVFTYALVLTGVIALLVYVVLFVFARPVVALFNKDGDVQLAQIVVDGLRLYALSFLLSGFNIVYASYFSASDKPRNAFIISLLRGLVVIVPVVFLLAHLFGMRGIWLAGVVTEFIVLCAALLLGMWERKKK